LRIPRWVKANDKIFSLFFPLEDKSIAVLRSAIASEKQNRNQILKKHVREKLTFGFAL
jgi:hypothetical protein